MDRDSPVSHDDPQFVKILETCLKMEIAVMQEKFDANTEEVKRLKATMRTEINNRKQLKARVVQMDRIKTTLNETLTRLYASISETSDTLEATKANVDDQYKLLQLKTEEYQDILAEYKKTWHAYRAIYEEFPLAKARNAAKIDFEKLKIQYMVMTYKKAEMMTIIKQRRHIDWILTRCKIVEFAMMMLEYAKLEKTSMKLERNMDYRRKELHSIEMELQILRKQEEDQERMRKQKILEMAPPKINIPYRKIYNENRMRTKVQSKQYRQQFNEIFDDNISINTLVLEELCINENAAALPDNTDIESTRSANAECTAIEMEAANLNDTAIPEKTDTRVTLIVPDVEANAEKAALIDNDVEMKETHSEETQKSQESVKAQPCSRTKENSLKHNAAKNAQEEIEAKRIRLQREDNAESSNKISAPQSSVIIEEVDLTSSPLSGPKIAKVETVHYNIAPIISMPKYVQRSSVIATNKFSPVHYTNEYCESMSSFDQDFISKGPSSLFEGSLCNYRLSPNSNISPICNAEDVQMSPPKYALQQDNKNKSGDTSRNTSSFQFSNFMKKREKTENDFTLF